MCICQLGTRHFLYWLSPYGVAMFKMRQLLFDPQLESLRRSHIEMLLLWFVLFFFLCVLLFIRMLLCHALLYVVSIPWSRDIQHAFLLLHCVYTIWKHPSLCVVFMSYLPVCFPLGGTWGMVIVSGPILGNTMAVTCLEQGIMVLRCRTP